MRIGDAQYTSAPPLANGLPGYRDPADPCGYGLTMYNGACIPDDSPALLDVASSRIVDWKILPGMNWGVVIAALLAGYVLIQKARGK